MKKTIGIIGGVGPLAGVDLHNKIINNTKALTDQEHLSVIHASCSSQISDRTQYILDTAHKPNPAPALFDVTRLLYEAGARVVGIPCNSAHAAAIFPELQKKIQTTFSDLLLVNMIEEVKNHILQLELSETNVLIGLLATSGTYASNTYKTILESYDIKVLYPKTQEDKEKVHSAIYHPTRGIKACSFPVDKWAQDILWQQARLLADEGATHVILGCTELPLACESIDFIPTIDSVDILAKALIRHAIKDH